MLCCLPLPYGPYETKLPAPRRSLHDRKLLCSHHPVRQLTGARTHQSRSQAFQPCSAEKASCMHSPMQPRAILAHEDRQARKGALARTRMSFVNRFRFLQPQVPGQTRGLLSNGLTTAHPLKEIKVQARRPGHWEFAARSRSLPAVFRFSTCGESLSALSIQTKLEGVQQG